MIDLRQRISNAVAVNDGITLQRKWQEIEDCFDVLSATNGTHIQVH